MKSSVGRRQCARTPTKEFSRPDDRPRRDRGFTLVEVIISIALMALLVVPILLSVQATIRASTLSREAAQVETVLVNAADRVNRATPTCNAKGYEDYVIAAVFSHGWWHGQPEVVAGGVRHEYYDPTQSPPWVPGICPQVGHNDKHVIQRVSITVTSPEHGVSRNIEVVKSDDI